VCADTQVARTQLPFERGGALAETDPRAAAVLVNEFDIPNTLPPARLKLRHLKRPRAKPSKR